MITVGPTDASSFQPAAANRCSRLRLNDKKLIVQAAAQAQKAADFILGIKHEEAPTEQKELVTA